MLTFDEFDKKSKKIHPNQNTLKKYGAMATVGGAVTDCDIKTQHKADTELCVN